MRATDPILYGDPDRELAEDLDELRWHVDHLRARLAARVPIAGTAMSAVSGEVGRRLDALDAALRDPPAPGDREDPPLVHHQPELRALYHATAMLDTAPDWHSAPGSLSHPIGDLTPLSHIPGFNDYQRGFLPWLRRHEQHLLLGSQPALAGRALVFSSGMGAIQTVVQLVLGRARRLLLGKRVYYETQSLLALAGARDRLLPLDEAEPRPEAWADAVRAADAIFVDTVTLDRAATRVEVARLYRAIEASGRAGIEVILDNTAPGPELAIPPPPAGARLYVVESLLKNYQAGLDLAAAGMLIVVASADAAADARLIHDLEVLRSTNGTNLAAYSARLLPLLPRERILARLRRQARNATVIAEALRDRCDVSCVNHAGLAFVVHPAAPRLLGLIELLALARRARVVRGTSFGFNVTRVSLVPGLDDQMRIACGMEHAAAAAALARLLGDAVAAIDDPRVAAACIHPSRLFPDYPRRTTASPDELDALARHAQHVDRLVADAVARR